MSIQLQGNNDSIFSNDIVAPNIPTNAPAPGYQQGIWTPVPTLGTVTVTRQSWARIGNLVLVNAELAGFTDTSNNVITILGLPYTNSVDSVGSVMSSNVSTMPNASHVSASGIDFYISDSDAGNTANSWYPVKYSDAARPSSGIFFTLWYPTTDTTWTPQNGATLS